MKEKYPDRFVRVSKRMSLWREPDNSGQVRVARLWLERETILALEAHLNCWLPGVGNSYWPASSSRGSGAATDVQHATVKLLISRVVKRFPKPQATHGGRMIAMR
jgi:hypothetical protein